MICGLCDVTVQADEDGALYEGDGSRDIDYLCSENLELDCVHVLAETTC